MADERRPSERAGSRPKGQQRAETILDAAAAVLTREGHAALSLRQVAATAGVRLGHLQYYYPSRRHLVRAVIERELACAAAAVEARARTAVGAGDPVAALSGAILDQQRRGSIVRLAGELRALAARDPEIAASVRSYYARYWRALVGALTAGNPRLGRARAERRSALLVALLEGLLQFRSPDAPAELPLLGLERELVDVARLLGRA